MITVKITKDDGQQLGEIRIERLPYIEHLDDMAKAVDMPRYVAQYAVERGGAIGLYTRSFIFKRLERNVLALVEAALLELSEEELVLENGPVDPSDLARRFDGVSGALPSKASDPKRYH